MIKKIKIFDIEIDNLNEQELLDSICSIYKSNEKSLISNVNVHALNLAYKDIEFKEILNDSKIVFNDGYGVKYLSNLILKTDLKAAMTPPSWMYKLYDILPRDTKIFLLGDEDDIIKKYHTMVKNKHKNIDFVGYHNGFFNDSQSLIQKINDLESEIIIVGMGMPYQEKWIYNNLKAINCKYYVCKTCNKKGHTEWVCPNNTDNSLMNSLE